MSVKLLVLGDALLDVDVLGEAARLMPDAPVPVLEPRQRVARPGGAGLAAALAARYGAETTLAAPMVDDGFGDELRSALMDAGVEVVALDGVGTTPRKTRMRTDGQSIVRLDEGAIDHVRAAAGPVDELMAGADAVLVADYGGVLCRQDWFRALVRRHARLRPIVWDPHPRGRAPVSGVTCVTPNQSEVVLSSTSGRGAAPSLADIATVAAARRREWGVGAALVSLGSAGALLVDSDSSPMMIPTEPAPPGRDTCGAGDCMAGALATALGGGAVLSEAAAAAVARATAYVHGDGAAGLSSGTPADGPAPSPAARSAEDIVAACHREGRTLVATSGCFDLVHAGHLQLLRQARRLGDVLVVLLNSDVSVRRLKGPGRPMVSEHERAELLASLECVDAVVCFDEDTPNAVLRRLHPHIFAKGGDYHLQNLPETEVLAEWGGQAVVLPYLNDHSTTRLIQEASRAQSR